jgi:tetratricopeptide (TPR) repeat protein
LADDLERWLADQPVLALRESLWVRLRRWSRGHRPLVASLATAAILLLGTAILLTASWLRGNQREREQVHREAEKRLLTGQTDGRAGNFQRALQDLQETIDLCNHRNEEQDFQALREEAQRNVQQFQRYDRLRRNVEAIYDDTLADLVARTQRNSGATRPVSAKSLAQERHKLRVQRCTEALACYRVEEDEQWGRLVTDGTLRPSQVEDVRRLVGQALDSMTMELAFGVYEDKSDPATNRRALVLLERAAALHGATNAVWVMRAIHYRRLHDDAAADRATETRKQTPLRTAHDYYVRAAVDLHIKNDPKAALESYRHASHLAADHFNAYLGEFLCHSSLNDSGGQIQALTTCLALRPHDVYLWWLRGMTYFGSGKHAWAREDFEAAVGRDPAFALGWFYRGRMTIALDEEEGDGRWFKAEQDFCRALEADPKLSGVRSWRAIARAKLNRHRDAVIDAEESVREDPEGGLSNFYAARAYAQAVRAVRAGHDPMPHEALAHQYAERCLALLAKAVQCGFTDLDRLQPGSDFDPVRADPKFQELLRKTEGMR